jgi:dUTP pyrophosphatase
MMEKKGVLTREDILELLKSRPPLIAAAVNLEEQLQPNGIDLTVREIASFSSRGNLTETNEGRELSRTSPVVFDAHGGADLMPGAYLVTFNEVVSLPADVMALGRPRSSLNRCGVSMHSAVWDAGYSGRSQSMLVVYNPHGFRLHKNARVMQLVFFHTTRAVDKGYSGKYQNENIQDDMKENPSK